MDHYSTHKTVKQHKIVTILGKEKRALSNEHSTLIYIKEFLAISKKSTQHLHSKILSYIHLQYIRACYTFTLPSKLIMY